MQCEYKIVRNLDTATERRLNELAQEGWRLKAAFIDSEDVVSFVMELDYGRVTPGNSEREMV